jgi:N-acetyl-alpha-D-glucosaminyl L-malate synthase BshA
MICYPSFGGSGVVATELGQALADRGHTVHFICYNIPARLRGLSEKVLFHPVEVVTYPLFKFPPYTLALATRLAQTIRNHHIDLIHVHYAIPHSISAQLARDMTGRRDIPVVTTLHGTDVQLVGLDPSYRDVTKYSMERCCGLTAVSEDLARTTVREFGLAKRVEVIPNFVNLERFRRRTDRRLRRTLAADGEKVVLHVSNFRPVKRIADVVKVFHRMHRKVPCRLVLIGDGPERADALALADRLGIGGSVRAFPFVPTVERYLAVADLLLLPSAMESFGLAALEAMACQTPVLAYRVGGIPEVLGEDEGGRMVPFGNWMAMAAEGVRILRDDHLARVLGERGRERAARLFEESAVVARYEGYYRRQLAEDPAP